MAQADLLIELFKTASKGDQVSFRKIAESLIQEEKAKGHRILAERLVKSLQPTRFEKNSGLLFESGNNTNEKNLIYAINPERSIDSLILSSKIATELKELVEEQHRSELLHSHNLHARNRLIFIGPPGNGKTTLAEAMAHDLMYPLIVVRYEKLIGSYLGETATRLKSILDYAKTQRCVLFFDEFETIGKERGDTNETGEIKRVVSSLLLEIDSLPDYVVVIAASNHPELLDRAVWRRFQVRVKLDMPTVQQLEEHITTIAKRCKVDFGYSTEELVKSMLGSNFAEVEEFCLGVARRIILDREIHNTRTITKLKLEQWKNRLKSVKSKKS